MKRLPVIVTVAVVGAWLICGAGSAQGAEVRGTFVRLTEQRVGEREHLAVVVKPFEQDDHVTVLVPRKSDLAALARRLKKGQKIEIAFVKEDGQMWAKRIEGGRGPDDKRKGDRERKGERERDRPREKDRKVDREREGEGERRLAKPAEMREIVMLLRQLRKDIELLKRQINELRAENERLGAYLRKKGVSPKAPAKKTGKRRGDRRTGPEE